MSHTLTENLEGVYGMGHGLFVKKKKKTHKKRENKTKHY